MILVLFAAMFAALCGFAALAVDLGNVAQTHQNAQDAADSAAVSGAQLLSDSTETLPKIVTAVEEYVQANDPAITATARPCQTRAPRRGTMHGFERLRRGSPRRMTPSATLRTASRSIPRPTRAASGRPRSSASSSRRRR